ncbi:MAG: hypothetical protein ACYDCC_03010 [Actinomycetota bacterium]
MANTSTSSLVAPLNDADPSLLADARRLLDRDFLYDDPASYRAGVLAVLELLGDPARETVTA